MVERFPDRDDDLVVALRPVGLDGVVVVARAIGG
jgi:hypothetical protein